MPVPRSARGLALVLVLVTGACGKTPGDGDAAIPPGPSPVAKLGFGSQELHLSWPAVDAATHYRLLQAKEGADGFTQVGTDLTSTAVTWKPAIDPGLATRLRLEACNTRGCTGTDFTPAERLLGGIDYIKASNTHEWMGFGRSVALSADGNTLAVAASREGGAATGVGGDQSVSTAEGAGAVYIFARTETGWSQQAYLKTLNPEAGALFGTSLALSADGNTLAAGATMDSGANCPNGDQGDNASSGRGAVYVFTRSGTAWSQQGCVKGMGPGWHEEFGLEIALSGDGTTLAVGTQWNSVGAVYLFARAGTAWSPQTLLPSPDATDGDSFGSTLALSSDGNTLVAGAEKGDNAAKNSGAVHVFTRSGTEWSRQAYLEASNAGEDDFFGGSLALSADGDTLAVGARLEDGAATGTDGDQNDRSASWAGAVYLFGRSGASWSQQAYVKASNAEEFDRFGASVELSGDGRILAVGATHEGSAAVGIGGEQGDSGAPESGAVYVFTRSSDNELSQLAYVKASNTGYRDAFGSSLALSADGNTLVVGTGLEDGAATGINGNQSDDSAENSGAVYVY